MTTMWSVVLGACLLLVHHQASGRRLLLGEDGFARVDGTPGDPATGITVSSWVNITEFPGGVAPIMTIISEDASYQIAFFVRHDGAGVLWGGPAAAQLPQDEYVDRQPRSRFGNGRKRRNAVDYTMGLGNVMNILGTRKERSNTWTPMNFVDVSEMGVADLETSGSNTNNHYENWYDVGYELQMQESANPEPRIITKPSGENDFVVINWDGQNVPQVPQMSSNQWDPLNEAPEFTVDQLTTKIKAPENEKFVWSQEETNKDGGWSSQVIPVGNNAQRPVNIRQIDTTTTTTTTTTLSPPSTSTTNKPLRTRKRPTRPFVPDLRRPSSSENVKTYRPAPEGFRYNTRRRQQTTPATTSTTVTTTTTTTKRPVHFSHEVLRNSQESRVPLWERLKKTSSEEKSLLAETTETSTATPTTSTTTAPKTTRTPITRIRATTTPRPSIFRSTTQAPRFTTRPPVTSTRVPAGILKKTVIRSTTTTTEKPSISVKSRPAQRFSHEEKDRKSYNNLNGKRNPIRKQTANSRNRLPMSHSLDEFKRVMEGKPAVEDNGNKVVVYSMPITDVDAFNRMYEQYQQTESRQNPRINLHAVYEQAREGEELPVYNEEEENQNRLEQVPEPLPVLTYKEEPLHYAESEPAPIIIKETEIVAPEMEKEEEVIPIPSYDDSSFRPLQVDDPYITLESDYSQYYPYVHKAEPILITTLNDKVPQSTERQYSNEGQFSAQVGNLPILQQIPIAYESAVPVEQDISGQQAGFYQEPSRISHEQLPPEYTQKPQEEQKRVFSQKDKVVSNENRNYRPYVQSQEITRPVQRPIQNTYQKSQEQVYESPETPNLTVLSQNLPQPFHSSEQVDVPTNFHPSRPISVEAIPVEEPIAEQTPAPIKIQEIPIAEETTPEIVKDIPLNVNFRKMPYSFDVNTWYHITFTWNSFDHVLRIYINGQLAGILENTIPDMKMIPTTGMMLLGKTLLPSLTGFDPTSHLSGEMSNFVVWGESLTPQEVNNVFTCGPAPLHPVLLAWNTTPLRVYNDAAVQQAPPICGISS